MKFVLSFLVGLLGLVVSCAPVDKREAGGGAFDDSELARALDANAALPGENQGGARSFEEWREQE
ncbi:MAG: hypothetical protein AAGC74_01410 [Verrucomicrobiota bacterium]